MLTARILSIFVFASLLFATGAQASDTDSTDKAMLFDGVNPAEVHRFLAEHAQRQLESRRAISRAAGTEVATNWQDYDVFYYEIHMELDYTDSTIDGYVDVHARPTVASLDTLMLNLDNNMTVDSIYNASGNLSYLHQNDHIWIHLDAQYAQGEELEVTVAYHGSPNPNVGFQGFDFGIYNGRPMISSLSEPYLARTWWPCNDIPADKADSFNIYVTVENGLIVSSNGLEVEDIDNGDGTHTSHWRTNYPMTTYLFSVNAHDFTVWEDYYDYSPTDSMPVIFYVLPEQYSNSLSSYSVTAGAIGILAQRFDEYPFINEKYGHTQFLWGGGMEHQTNTSLGISSFAYSTPVVVHELAHQWWGDLVTCQNWHDIWLNEGFASYSEALYYEILNGPETYRNYMLNMEYPYGSSIYREDTVNIGSIFSSIVYDKGAWVLHMLRHIIGDQNFFDALLAYRTQYYESTATTADFQAVCEAVSGQDLDYFFQEWIYGTYYPRYRKSFLSEPDPGGGWSTYFHLEQLQTTEPLTFTMPVDLQVERVGGEDTITVFNDERVQDFVIHTPDQVNNVFVDPEHWISRTVVSTTYKLNIITAALPNGTQAAPYLDSIVVKGGYGSATYSVKSGVLPDGWELNSSSGVISGTTVETGDFNFMILAVDNVASSQRDSVDYSITVAEAVSWPGNANHDLTVDVQDAVFLVNYVFKGGPAPVEPNWADANGDCTVNISDAVYIVNLIFKGGPEPLPGCVQ